jgi:hypothetical protein
MGRSVKHRLVIFSPDKDTDYCYLDMTVDEALAKFKTHEDWVNIYEPRGYVPTAKEMEFDDSFMLWRNIGSDLAGLFEQRDAPAELVDVMRRSAGSPKR